MKKITCLIVFLMGLSVYSQTTPSTKDFIVTSKNETFNTPEANDSGDFKISPNPSKGYIKILGEDTKNLKSIKVYNVLGSLVKNIKITIVTNQLAVDLSDLSKGLYLVKLNTKNSETTTQKLIIE